MDNLIKLGGGEKPTFTYIGSCSWTASSGGWQTINMSVSGAIVGKRYLVVFGGRTLGYSSTTGAYSCDGLSDEIARMCGAGDNGQCAGAMHVGIATSTTLGNTAKRIYANYADACLTMMAFLIE